MKRRKRLIRHDENDENVGMLQVFGVSCTVFWDMDGAWEGAN